MKKRSEAFEDGYNFMYMIGRCNAKEINAYFKSFGLTKKEMENIDEDTWNKYDIGKSTKKVNDFNHGKDIARIEMVCFNSKLEDIQENYEQYKHCGFEGDYEAHLEMLDIVEYAENKKEMEKLIEKYYQGIKAMRRFFDEIEFKQGYEI